MVGEGRDSHERLSLLPKVVTLHECNERLTEERVLEGGYRVFVLPEKLKEHFRNGAHIIIIEDEAFVKSLPDLGGKPSGKGGLPFHQDLDKKNVPMQVLVLWQNVENNRNASTLVIVPEIATKLLPDSEAYFKQRKDELRKEAVYDERFNITEEQFNRCFDTEDGYEKAVRAMTQEHADEPAQVFIRLSLLGYLVRGKSADELVQRQIHTAQGSMEKILWKKPRAVFVLNPATLHGRNMEQEHSDTTHNASGDEVKRLYCIF